MRSMKRRSGLGLGSRIDVVTTLITVYWAVTLMG